MRGVSGESTWRRSRIVVPVGSPAPGADWSLAVPAGHVYQLVAVTARLVTSAVVANRAARLILGDGTSTWATLPASAVQAATATNDYTWAVGAVASALGTVQLGTLPDVALQAAWTVGVSTALIDATDQWSAVRVTVLDTTARRGRVDLDSLPDLLVGVVELGPDVPA